MKLPTVLQQTQSSSLRLCQLPHGGLVFAPPHLSCISSIPFSLLNPLPALSIEDKGPPLPVQHAGKLATPSPLLYGICSALQ